jgi:hypothetical protein
MITIAFVTLSSVGLAALVRHHSRARRHRAFVRRLYDQIN